MDKRKSFVVDIDRDSYFTQYAWALENFDLRAVFNDFLETEKGIIDEASRQKLWEDYKKANDDGVVTELQMDVLSYVMKYEKGVYKKGQTVAEVYDGHGRIHLLEPGYYFIEVKGASGLSAQGSQNQVMSGLKYENPTKSAQNVNVVKFYNKDPSDGTYECCFYVDDELNFIFEIKEGDDWKYTYGWLEANQKFLFLYQIGSTEVVSEKKAEADLHFAERSDDDPFVLFDFCEWNDDPLKEDFGSFKFVVNKISLKEKKMWVFETSNFLCGMDEASTKDSLLKLRDDTKPHYYEIIEQNIRRKSGKLFTYSEALDKNQKKYYDYFNKNYLHGGDGGYVSTIIYIDKATLFDYNIGQAKRDGSEPGIKYDLSEDSTTTYLKAVGSQTILCAEQGMCSTAEGSYIARANAPQFGGPSIVVTGSYKDTASKDFSKELDSHLGENFDYSNFESGAGRGVICIDGKIVHQCVGGGEFGEGLRLNEFYDAYYQGKQDGSIHIKYLCAKYARKFKADFNIDSPLGIDGRPLVKPLFYIGDYIPIGEKFNLKLSTNSMTGGFLSVPSQAINRDRTINYLSFDLDTTRFSNGEHAKLDFKEYDESRVYIDLKEDNGHFKYHGSLSEEIFDPFIGLKPGRSLNLEFTMTDSICFLNYLLFAYNSAKSGSVSLKISSFNSTTYDLLLTLSNYSNFKFMNVFEEIIQLSFEYKNEIPLNDYFDIFGQKVLDGCVAKIDGLEYSLVDPSHKNFTAYVEGYKFLVPKYTKLYLKFKFNTSRVCLDTDLSTFFGAIEYYKKNIDFSHRIVLDSYFSAGSEDNFQCIEFIPSTSQDIQIYIKKYTFTLDLFADLYNNIFINNLSSKTEFEVGESALLSVKLKNFERISHLLNKAYVRTDESGNVIESNIQKLYDGRTPVVNGKDAITGYSFYESTHKFESFVAFKDGKITHPYEYNIIDVNIPTFLNRRGCNGVGVPVGTRPEIITYGNKRVKQWHLTYGGSRSSSETIVDTDTHNDYDIQRFMSSNLSNPEPEKGLVVQSSRIFGLNQSLPGSLRAGTIDSLYQLTENSPFLKTDFSKIALVSQNIVAEDDALIVLTFKECSIEIRLSSDYMPGQKVVAVENNQTADISFFKPYHFMFLMSGGPTGNGEAGGDGDLNQVGEPYAGGSGGDGYIGGNGGQGHDAKDWAIIITYVKLFDLIPIPYFADSRIQLVLGAPGGLAGRGFSRSGVQGGNGGSIVANMRFGFANEWTQRIIAARTCLYCGRQFIKPFVISKKSDDFKKISVSLRAGSQGLSLNKAGAHLNGRGGGGGLASTVRIQSSKEHYLEYEDTGGRFGFNYSELRPFSEIDGLAEDNIKQRNAIYVDGGFPGACRGFYNVDSAYNHYKVDDGKWYMIYGEQTDWFTAFRRLVKDVIADMLKGVFKSFFDSNKIKRHYRWGSSSGGGGGGGSSSGGGGSIFGGPWTEAHQAVTTTYWQLGGENFLGVRENDLRSANEFGVKDGLKLIEALGQQRQSINWLDIAVNDNNIYYHNISSIRNELYSSVGYYGGLTDKQMRVESSNSAMDGLDGKNTLFVGFFLRDGSDNAYHNRASIIESTAHFEGNAMQSHTTGIVRIDAYQEEPIYIHGVNTPNSSYPSRPSYSYDKILAGETEVIESKYRY